MTRKAQDTFKRIDEALDRFARGEGLSRVVTRNLDGKNHFAIEIVRGDRGYPPLGPQGIATLTGVTALPSEK